MEGDFPEAPASLVIRQHAGHTRKNLSGAVQHRPDWRLPDLTIPRRPGRCTGRLRFDAQERIRTLHGGCERPAPGSRDDRQVRMAERAEPMGT
jgi:hypothetical protein